MKSRQLHKLIGLVMLLPLLAWAATGLVFFIKPGYEGAYEILHLKTYPIDEKITLSGDRNWEEIRVVKSILGMHLLIKSADEMGQFDPITLERKANPSPHEVKLLIEDAISSNIERYGSVISVEGRTAYTTTGIEITLNWNELRFSQHGFDKRIIGLLYKVHYLQWTPWSLINQVLGFVGLFLLISLTLIGAKIYVNNRK